MVSLMVERQRRRTFLRLGLVATVGGIAGCSGGGSTTTDDEDDPTPAASTTASSATASSTPTDEPTAEPDGTTEQPTEVERTPYRNPRQAIDDWLGNTSNYEGNVRDRRSDSEVDVQVGTPSDNGNFSFSPPAIRIQTGTRVVWQWTGEGGEHNVVERDGVFSSGEPKQGGGLNYRYTFEETGLYLYRCTIHNDFGMRGAVLVEEPQTLSGYPRVDDWLSDYEYTGRLDDERGRDSVDISVGAQGNGGSFAFRPIAILVSPGTELDFEWTGRGGNHSVKWEETPVDVDDSGTTDSARNTYSVTLDEPGVYLYKCGAHNISGGHGAVVVYS
jgi:halocyanin-like protein